MCTEARDGYLVDTGPDALTAGYTSYLRLVNDLGLGDRLVDTGAVIGLVRDGRVIDNSVVRAHIVNDPRRISDRIRGASARSSASGRSPSTLTISTR